MTYATVPLIVRSIDMTAYSSKLSVTTSLSPLHLLVLSLDLSSSNKHRNRLQESGDELQNILYDIVHEMHL
jgi:hypothetical protein